jgi:hypothetical protein
MTKHVILFLAANPDKSSGLALDQQCAAIDYELRMTSHRDHFEFHSKWGVTVDDMMRHLGQLKPTIIHFTGDGTAGSASTPSGIYLHGERDGAQLVTARALTMMLRSAAASTRVVVLNACFSEPQADAVRSVVDCVVGMAGAIGHAAAHSFAASFYRALGNGSSVGNAVDQAVAVLAAKGMPDEVMPRCLTRDGVDKYQVTLSPPDGPGNSAGPTQLSTGGGASPSRPPGTPLVTRVEILTGLSRLRTSEFDEVLFRANIPMAHLPGASAAQATRAIEVIRYFEQRNQLDQLARILDEVMRPS